jgi:cytochrome c-type biogenesis protein CcmH/NrfF
VLLIPCIPLTATVAQTQTDQELNRAAREIFENVLSPYCPGRTISNCPSPQADELRASIRQQLAAGETPDEVKEELYAVFGDELRTIPRAQGFGLLAWVVPGLAFLVGGWAIFVWIRRINASQKSRVDAESIELDADADARIAAEMAELER